MRKVLSHISYWDGERGFEFHRRVGETGRWHSKSFKATARNRVLMSRVLNGEIGGRGRFFIWSNGWSFHPRREVVG